MKRNITAGRLNFSTALNSATELSDVIFIAVGTPSRRGDGHADLSFVYGEGNRQAITYQSVKPKNRDMFIFPAWLKHWVSPFNSDCVRVSVSGNVHDSAPLNQIKKGGLVKE